MKELIVFTNNGQTYHFNGVTDFRPTTTGFSFNYFGKATQLTRSAVFNNTCVAGYALREEKMKINWKVRFKSKSFWLAVIPAIALVVQAVMALFGFEYNFDETVNKLIVIVNAVFVLLVILGVVNDPTTTGIRDSDYAMTKETPKETPLVVDKYGDGQEFTERKD